MKLPLAVLALAISASVAGCATTTSPTGRTQQVGAVPPEQLNQMGAQAFGQLKAQKQQSNDARLTGAMRCVVDAVARQLPGQYRGTWDSALFVDNNPNAFALPGGKVGLYTGIFSVARNQDQLAAVVAHEIGHVVARHHDERVTRQMQAQMGLAALGAVAGNRLPAGSSELASVAAQAFFLLPNSRAQEEEADELGQRYMAEAGFDPRQAVDLWQNMLAVGGARPPEILSTHPDPRSRLGDMQARAAALVPVYEQARAAGRRPACN